MPISRFMRQDTKTEYKNFDIYLSRWDEYCVCRRGEVSMLSWNSGFKTMAAAKELVDRVSESKELDKNALVDIATAVHTQKDGQV